MTQTEENENAFVKLNAEVHEWKVGKDMSPGPNPPEDTGVYWYSKGSKQDEEVILYIGDSKNLRKRIKDETGTQYSYNRPANNKPANPSNLPSTNYRLRQLINETINEIETKNELINDNENKSYFKLHYRQTDGIPVCEILYDCKCNRVKCEKDCLNWEEDCVYFNLKDIGLIYKTSLSKLARIAPKQTLAVIQAWNGTSSEKATMSLERVLLMSYWLEFHRLPHWNLTF